MRYMIANVGIDAYDKQEIDEKLTLIKTASGTIASFNTDLASALKECEVSFTAYQASGTPTPATPIPIIGFSSATLTRTGKNLCSEMISGYSVGASGAVQFTGNSSLAIAPVKVGEKYTITTDDASGFVGGFFTSKPAIGSVTYNGSRIISNNKTFTAPITGWVAFRTSYTYSTPMLECGETATAYAPYSGTSVVIPFGDTYYGGVLDVIRGKGKVTWKGVNANSLAWSINNVANHIFVTTISDIKPTGSDADRQRGVICSHYSPDTQVSISQDMHNETWLRLGIRFFIRNNAYSNVNDFVASLSGVMLVYELATPIEIDLTPEQIATLVGDNNVFCDIPTSSVEVEYLTSQAKGVADVVEVLTKPIEVSGTLTAGSTSITLSDEHITTDSTIDIYTSDGTEWNDVTVTTGVVVITFDAQASDIGVKVRVS